VADLGPRPAGGRQPPPLATGERPLRAHRHPHPPPEPTALGPWWTVTTDALGITALEDRRAYLGRRVVLTLQGTPAGAGPALTNRVNHHGRLQVETVHGRIADAGSGTGTTTLDWTVDGATADPHSGTDDQRPTWSVGAVDLTHAGGHPELRDIPEGALLTLPTPTLPTTPPAWVELTLIGWEA